MSIKRKNLQGITWIVLSIIWGLGWGLSRPRFQSTSISWIIIRNSIELIIPVVLIGILFFLKKNDAIYTVNVADFLRYFIFIIFSLLGIIIIYFLTAIVLMGLSDANVL